MIALFVLLYFALTAGIGIYMVRQKSNVAEFFVAKKGLTVGLIIPLLFAELIAGAGTVGNAATAYKIGISSVWVNWGMSIGCLAVFYLAGKMYLSFSKKYGAMSVPQIYMHRFDAKTRSVMMFILVAVYLIIFAQQPVAAAGILGPLLGVNKMMIGWIVGAIFIFLAITGGMKGLAWMNVLHSFVMYLGLGIVCVVAVTAAGGIDNMQAVLPAKMFAFNQPDMLTVIGWVLGTSLSFFAASTVVVVLFGAKNQNAARNGILWASGLVLIFALFPALIGLAGKVLLPTASPNSILYVVANQLGPVYAAMASMGILAAILSTAPALLLISTTMITQDLVRVIKPGISEKEEMKWARIFTISLGLIATYFGMQSTSILAQMAGAFQIRAVAGVVLLVAIFWPRVDSRAAFWSMLLGGTVAAVWHFAGNPYCTSLYPSLAVGVPILIILTLMAKKPIADGHDKYLLALKELDLEEEEPNKPTIAQ
ncbi:sodium:solute symporter [Desulfosporosinus sp.]|uniref:sodium:solute symporter family protein n=1 Tax=Desulfosporosinus sp. TaxID=157907 RepID=UPI0025C1319A|nr:sodium:solute symporter family protein [Desulfosporosinus sp.]MBC2722269.1 sodium:solute symporter family protein [Desulfosporosinus sp.]MBC2726007.1 sodium:solute symporter family protein [Desulfosporosinus sp.]